MNDELQSKLKAAGVSDAAIAILEEQELSSEDALRRVTAAQLTSVGMKLGSANAIVALYTPVPVAPATSVLLEEIPEGAKPSESQVNTFANQMGIDPSMLSMLMFANMGASAGLEMDLSSVIPIAQVVGSYTPKLKNIVYMVMGQIEARLRTPIIVINDDGSVNPRLTQQYVMELEEGFEPSKDDIYYDENSKPHAIIGVGVDAQSIYDADPLDSSKALKKNGMGEGRISWTDVSMEVRQLVHLAAHDTGEIVRGDEGKEQWLRSNINKHTTRLNLAKEFPKAHALFAERQRTGTLPTLRVQLSGGARRPEIMPRRRRLGDNERKPVPGATFRGERNTEYER